MPPGTNDTLAAKCTCSKEMDHIKEGNRARLRTKFEDLKRIVHAQSTYLRILWYLPEWHQ